MLPPQDWSEPPPAQPPTPWWGESLSTGAPGIALLHIARARAGLGPWELAHAWAAATTDAPVTANASSSLFAGAPAVAFALAAAGECDEYARALDTLDGHIATLTHRRLDDAHARIDRGELPDLTEWDLISGLTGIGSYLLHRCLDNPMVRDILTYLICLTRPLHVNDVAVPGWWSGHGPSSRLPLPGGHGNFGMAHGISGPLALLSTALRRGISVPGQVEAIKVICAWLDKWQRDHGSGCWWPQWITLDDLRALTPRLDGPMRPSWCYGTPGLARAQQLAGLALGDSERTRMAEDALLACITDRRQLSQLADTSLCHGWAGLVHTVWRAAADADTNDLATCLPGLRAELVNQHGASGHTIGLLAGAAGVALTLHSTAADVAPASWWDACLLING